MIKFGFLTVLYLYYSSDKPEVTGGLFLPALMAQLERSTGVRGREWPGMTFLVAALGGLKFTGRFPRCRAAYTLGAAAAIHPSYTTHGWKRKPDQDAGQRNDEFCPNGGGKVQC